MDDHSVKEEGGKDTPINADRSICVSNTPLFQVITYSYTELGTWLLLSSVKLPAAKANLYCILRFYFTPVCNVPSSDWQRQ